MKSLYDHFLCKICGTPMVHDRIRGYHCHFEEHNEMMREMELRRRHFYNGKDFRKQFGIEDEFEFGADWNEGPEVES